MIHLLQHYICDLGVQVGRMLTSHSNVFKMCVKPWHPDVQDKEEITLSGGLCRIVNASGPAVGMSQLTDCHSTTDE